MFNRPASKKTKASHSNSSSLSAPGAPAPALAPQAAPAPDVVPVAAAPLKQKRDQLEDGIGGMYSFFPFLFF